MVGNVLKIKAIPVQACTGHEDSRRLRLPEVVGKQHMKVVSLSAFEPAAFILQGIFLVLTSVTGWVDPRAIVRPEGLYQCKIPTTGRIMSM